MRISTQQKLDNFRNMRAMITDYRREHNRFPTSKEFQDKLNMEQRTVERYKRVILAESKKALLNIFHHDMLLHVENAFTTINKNIKMFEEIRDNSDDNDEKMVAAKNVLESHLDAVRIMNDAPDYLGLEYNDNVNESNEEKHIHRQTESEERTQESIESLFS